ncbi:hypothetical protein N868_04890 [Cellulomonas carbonis T26]|uniref:Uncharacterized protein n=1 Tax=Cellulomonas carbonis T26 TaxID=947969 RepID=A0A0A0BXJ9_9CELL|nr:hypothetical protein N868_04890 [Cellulomonas carbonis T26]
MLDAYNGYWRAKVATFARPADPEPPELSQYAIDVAYTDVKANAFALQSDGVAIVGEPVLRPTVSAIDLADPGTATIVDCVDVSDWQPMFQATGESAAAPDQARRVLSTSTAFLSEGRWVIRTYEVDRGTQC